MQGRVSALASSTDSHLTFEKPVNGWVSKCEITSRKANSLCQYSIPYDELRCILCEPKLSSVNSSIRWAQWLMDVLAKLQYDQPCQELHLQQSKFSCNFCASTKDFWNLSLMHHTYCVYSGFTSRVDVNRKISTQHKAHVVHMHSQTGHPKQRFCGNKNTGFLCAVITCTFFVKSIAQWIRHT